MESYGYVAMFFAMAAENANIPIPSEVILGFAGFLISQHILDNLRHRLRSRRFRFSNKLLARVIRRPASLVKIRKIYTF